MPKRKRPSSSENPSTSPLSSPSTTISPPSWPVRSEEGYMVFFQRNEQAEWRPTLAWYVSSDGVQALEGQWSNAKKWPPDGVAWWISLLSSSSGAKGDWISIFEDSIPLTSDSIPQNTDSATLNAKSTLQNSDSTPFNWNPFISESTSFDSTSIHLSSDSEFVKLYSIPVFVVNMKAGEEGDIVIKERSGEDSENSAEPPKKKPRYL